MGKNKKTKINGKEVIKASKVGSFKAELNHYIPRLWELTLTLAEVSSSYILIQQDDRFMSIVAGVLAIDASLRLLKQFSK
jgi:TctA family transporter